MKQFLYQPTNPFILTQPFGVNPFKYGYGPAGHPGIDCRARTGAPIYCACGGKVIRAGMDAQRGLNIEIRSENAGRFFNHKYFHGSELFVKVGDEVETGQVIMAAGSTGRTEGPHLHFELEEVTEDGKLVNGNNGHRGRVDPLPFMFNEPALKVNIMVKLIRALKERLGL